MHTQWSKEFLWFVFQLCDLSAVFPLSRSPRVIKRANGSITKVKTKKGSPSGFQKQKNADKYLIWLPSFFHSVCVHHINSIYNMLILTIDTKRVFDSHPVYLICWCLLTKQKSSFEVWRSKGLFSPQETKSVIHIWSMCFQSIDMKLWMSEVAESRINHLGCSR